MNIAAAVAGCRMLADAAASDRLATAETATDAHEAVSALLVLVGLHLEAVSRCLRGEADPRTIWTAATAAPPLRPEGHDLLLAAFDNTRVATSPSSPKKRRKVRR